MLNEVFHDVYVSNILAVIIAMPILLAVWSVLSVLFKEKTTWICVIAVAISIVLIIYITVFSRGESEPGLDLIPFSSFVRARTQPHMYRSMLMNVFLFFPLGLFLPYLIEGGIKRRILLTVSWGLLLSVTVELIQLIFSIGLCETDDVICNTLGAALGSLAYPLSVLWTKRKNKTDKSK
ncbi:MAG: VanZ family protein [Ruminococcus sp.]|nr:VanZ family protein [Ruminococcus sp.]